MAITNNFLFRGLQGSIGKTLVFRHCNGKTIVSKYPGKRKTRPTKKQLRQQERFRKAIAYAKAVMEDLELYSLYEQRLQKGKTVYQCAIRAYLKGQCPEQV